MTNQKRQVKFYGDCPCRNITNKLYTYKVNNKADAEKAIKRFNSFGYSIRAAWYIENGRSNRIK